jgi:Tol biopolymer transport system component
MKVVVQVVLAFYCFTVWGQMPDTEIFLSDIEIKNHLIKIEKTVNMSNHKGYDNQPCFMPDEKNMVFFSQADSNQKVHISAYNIRSKKTKRITATPTSEYSPMLAPDKMNFSVVMVEEDSSQRVWLFDLKTGAKKICLTQKTDSIGYYTWLGNDSILYYKLTKPHSLRVLNLKTGEDNWLCDSPTRSFKSISNTSFFYVIHEETQNLLYSFNIPLKKATLIATDKPDNQDYVYQPDLGFIKSEGSRLYRYSPETKVWVEVADFSAAGISKITRFAFSADKKHLAVVSNQ